MVNGKRSRNAQEDAVRHPDYVYLDRIGRALVMIASKDFEQSDQISFLSGAGYSIREISDMLSVKYSAVQKALERRRKQPKKRGRTSS